MSELRKTLTVAGVAILLAVVALVSTPRRSAPDAFFDRGEPFFPEFTDPDSAATLEVVQWDDATASAIAYSATTVLPDPVAEFKVPKSLLNISSTAAC